MKKRVKGFIALVIAVVMMFGSAPLEFFKSIVLPISVAAVNPQNGPNDPNYASWSQCYYPDDKLGNSNVSFAAQGCVVTALAKIAVESGAVSQENFNPAVANSIMKQVGHCFGKNSGSVIWGNAPNVLGLKKVMISEMPEEYGIEDVYDAIFNENYFVIVWVGKHAVQVDKESTIEQCVNDNETIIINDSLASKWDRDENGVFDYNDITGRDLFEDYKYNTKTYWYFERLYDETITINSDVMVLSN